jgi:hypothetical protein
MTTRLALSSSAAFWLTMNFLLWRSEFGSASRVGSPVPTEVVWRKILTSPDSSSLDVLHHGKRAGHALWTVTERQKGAKAADVTGDLPEAGVATGYRLELDGNISLGENPPGGEEQVHFSLNADLGTNREWRGLELRINQRDGGFVIRSKAAEKTVHLRTESGRTAYEQTFTFAELEDPRSLADTLSLPAPMLDMLGISGSSTNTGMPGLSLSDLPWEAREGKFSLGPATVRAYRLRTRLLDRWQAVLVISPVGEILRVELPDEWVLVSDEMGGL